MQSAFNLRRKAEGLRIPHTLGNEATSKGIQDARAFFWRLRERQPFLEDSERTRFSCSTVFLGLRHFFPLNIVVKQFYLYEHKRLVDCTTSRRPSSTSLLCRSSKSRARK